MGSYLGLPEKGEPSSELNVASVNILEEDENFL